MKKIRIMSRIEMAKEVEANPFSLHVLIIRDPNEEESEYIASQQYQGRRGDICAAAEIGMKYSKTYEVLRFHDFDKPCPGYVLASKEDIQKALEYAKDKDELIVACAAGISRSSAMAYVIARSEAPPEEAVTILDIERHWPNRHVLACGNTVLNFSAGTLVREIDSKGFDRI